MIHGKARSELQLAFMATCYRVDTERGCFDLRISCVNAAFDTCLIALGVSCWSLVTASNPGAKLHSAAQNERARQALLTRLDEYKWRYFPARNYADCGQWPVEESVVLLNVGQQDAIRIAREFGQLACVCGLTGQAPQLVWVPDEQCGELAG